jgi:cytochrome c biogenesis protein CcmG, thiol:disulfide interchange protein DsbE
MLSLVRALRLVVFDTGGMLTAPRTTLGRITGGAGANALWPILLYLLVTALSRSKELSRFAYLLDYGADTMLRRTRELFISDLRTDAIVLVITCVTLAVLAGVLSKGRVRPIDGATAGAWLLVPLAALKALGAVLDIADLNVWFMPHYAVDSPVVLVKGQVDWARFAIKCVTAYGWPLILALMVVSSLRRPAPASSSSPALKLRLGAAFVATLALTLVGASVYDVNKHVDRIRPLLPGDPLPDIALRELTTAGVGKKRIAVQSFRGQVLVLDFWASWCSPCRRSMPELDAIATDLGPRGLAVLGVNREPREPDEAAAALAKIGVKFPSVIDDRGYGDRLGLTTLPSSYVVDRQGTVRHFHMGYVEPAVVRAEVEALLAEP